MRLALALLLLCLAVPVAVQASKIDFAAGLSGWQEKIFSGRVDYRIVEEEGHKVLQAESGGRASALIHWQDIDPQRFPILRWRWKIDKVLEKGHAGRREGDDYPARLYIIFDSWLPNYARSINYIWASQVAPEQVVVNPYYRRSVMLTVESGAVKAGRWVIEERNLLDDYRRIFGGEIPRIRAVGIMVDGDNTGETSQAWFDWIEFVAEKG